MEDIRVSIEYCVEWNYKPNAAGLAAELKKAFGIESELIRSGGGAFEVRMNDELIFSKKSTGRFPEHQEIVDFINKRRS